MAVGRRGAKKYLNNENLIKEIIKSKKYHAAHPKLSVAESLTAELVKMLSMLVDRYAGSWNWRGYTYNEDMRSEAILALCQNAFKFDETKYKNPFGYYTQIAKNSFLSFRDREVRVREIRDNILEANGRDPSHTRQSDNEKRAAMPAEDSKDGKKREAELGKIDGKMETYAEIVPAISKLKDPDASLERKIAKLLNVDKGSFTSVQRDAMRCLPAGYTCSVDHDVEIAGVKGTVVTVSTKDGKTSTKRILASPFPRHRIPMTITALSVIAHKDILSRRQRDLNGDKPASLARVMPTTNQGTVVDPYRGRSLEYNDYEGPWGPFDKD